MLNNINLYNYIICIIQGCDYINIEVRNLILLYKFVLKEVYNQYPQEDWIKNLIECFDYAIDETNKVFYMSVL